MRSTLLAVAGRFLFVSLTAFAGAGCSSSSSEAGGDSEDGILCSPVSNTPRCGVDDNRLYRCVGATPGGEGVTKLIEDCGADKSCDDLRVGDSVCTPNTEYCARNITPRPAVCK